MTDRFRNRPVEVAALQWVGPSNCAEAFAFVGLNHDDWADDLDHSKLHVPTLDAPTAVHGDWLIKDSAGAVTVMRPAEFEARFEVMPKPEPFEPGTNYHTSVDHLRKDLMVGNAMWERITVKHQMDDPAAAAPAQRDAFAAALMAGSYSYTLAAVLGYAAKFGEHVANDLAFIADEILTNGDFDSLNEDVKPVEPPAGDPS